MGPFMSLRVFLLASPWVNTYRASRNRTVEWPSSCSSDSHLGALGVSALRRTFRGTFRGGALRGPRKVHPRPRLKRRQSHGIRPSGKEAEAPKAHLKTGFNHLAKREAPQQCLFILCLLKGKLKNQKGQQDQMANEVWHWHD